LVVSGDLTVDTNTLFVDSTNNRVGILDATPAVTLDIGSATDAIFVPSGTTAQRPGTPSNGYLRYNSDDAQFEGYADGAWGAIAGSGSGSAIEPQIFAGDGSTVNFTLTSAPTTENNLLVFIDGVFQAHDSYSVSGTTLTFSTAPANTRVITVYHILSNISGSNMIVDSMTGDGSDVTLTLSVAPVSENNVQVYIDGVYQSKSNYSISGTTLTFTTAPPSGTAVEAITHTQTTINEPAANTVTPAKIASGDFYFDTDTLYIDSTNNRVGVGTSSPMVDLNIHDTSTPRVALTNSTTGQTFPAGFELLVSGSDAYVSQRENANLIFSTNNTERMRIDSSGNLLVGTTSLLTPTASFSNMTLDGSITVGPNLGAITPSGTISVKELGGTSMSFFYGTTKVGSVTNTASATAYNTSSDARLKDVTGSARGLEVINALNPVAFNWKADGKADEGLLAQEVLEIVPNAVSGSEEEYYQMDYSKLVTHLIAGMKEQQTIIEDLKTRIETLENN